MKSNKFQFDSSSYSLTTHDYAWWEKAFKNPDGLFHRGFYLK